jgi:hypothetical protein
VEDWVIPIVISPSMSSTMRAAWIRRCMFEPPVL